MFVSPDCVLTPDGVLMGVRTRAERAASIRSKISAGHSGRLSASLPPELHQQSCDSCSKVSFLLLCRLCLAALAVLLSLSLFYNSLCCSVAAAHSLPQPRRTRGRPNLIQHGRSLRSDGRDHLRPSHCHNGRCASSSARCVCGGHGRDHAGTAALFLHWEQWQGESQIVTAQALWRDVLSIYARSLYYHRSRLPDIDPSVAGDTVGLPAIFPTESVKHLVPVSALSMSPLRHCSRKPSEKGRGSCS